MKNKSEIYIINILFSSLSILIIVFLIYPTLKGIENDSQKMVLSKEKLSFISSESKELENFKASYKDYQENLERINNLFVDSKNPVGLIEFLESEAVDLNIGAEINLSSPISNGNLNNQSANEFQISAKGSFSNVLKFSEKIENGSYLIQINNLTIKKLDQNKIANSNLVQADFSIQVLNNQ